MLSAAKHLSAHVPQRDPLRGDRLTALSCRRHLSLPPRLCVSGRDSSVPYTSTILRKISSITRISSSVSRPLLTGSLRSRTHSIK